jgi:hypothetical protein
MRGKTHRIRYATPLLILLSALATKKIQAQFDIEDSNSTASLRGIHNVGDGVAWASGTNGTVLRSEDGGYLWQTCTIPLGAEKLDFRGIQAFDENTAIVMSSGKGDLSRLYKTTDGCQSWKLLFTNPDKEGFWDAIQFIDRAHGYLLGDPVDDSFQLLRTEDGGNTWLESKNRTFRANPRTQGVFAASNSALWVSVHQNPYLAWGSGGTDGAMIYGWVKSPSAAGGSIGEGFRYQTMLGQKKQSSGIFSLCFSEDHDTHLVGVAVGGDYLKPDEITNTAASTQDLSSWLPAQTPPHGYRSAVAYDAQQKLWITVGPNGTDISTDDGKKWQPLIPSGYDPPDADKNWNALSLPFVVGSHGRIGRLRTIDLQPQPKPLAK